MPKDVAMPIESVIGQSVSSRSCRAEPAAPRRMPAAAKRRGRRQGEGPPTPVKMAEQYYRGTFLPVLYMINWQHRSHDWHRPTMSHASHHRSHHCHHRCLPRCRAALIESSSPLSTAAHQPSLPPFAIPRRLEPDAALLDALTEPKGATVRSHGAPDSRYQISRCGPYS